MKKSTFEKKGLGYLPDVPDNRDFLFAETFTRLKARPPVVDLRAMMSPIEDQGQLGSCTAQALVSGAEMLWKKQGLITDGSRLWLYYKEREIHGWTNEDTGAFIRDGIKVLASDGLAPERLWPYVISKYAVKPPLSATTMAKKYKIGKYYRLTTRTQIQDALVRGFTVTFGIAIYDSFYSGRGGVIPTPKKSERQRGGHAMQIVGYNEPKKQFIVRNSWGTSWGEKGYCYLTYDYMDQASDIWTYEIIDDGK